MRIHHPFGASRITEWRGNLAGPAGPCDCHSGQSPKLRENLMTYIQFFIVFSLPVTGLCYATLGAIKLPLSKRIGLDEAKVGG